MEVLVTAIPDVLIIDPKIHSDARGFFFESFNQKIFEEKTGIRQSFVQDNHSRSTRNVLRGLHYQIGQPQGKLVRVVSGCIFDVAVDLRKSSATFGKWVGVKLSEENKRLLWVPPGFAHGFIVTSESADVLYKTTDYWAPGCERTIVWNDIDLAINWPVASEPILAEKDQAGKKFAEADHFA
jgi:dTDP-4-dehydrorhamnose 3,5-epimerase